MFISVALNRVVDFLPQFDFGKMWSFLKVKEPTRPMSAQERSKRFHWVTRDGTAPVRPDDLMGHVYVTPNNRAVYWYGRDEDEGAKKAYYLSRSPEQLLAGRDGAVFDEVRESAGAISDEDRRHLVCDYYGDQKGEKVLANTLG